MVWNYQVLTRVKQVKIDEHYNVYNTERPGCYQISLIDIENLMITKKDTLYTNALIRLQDGPHPKGL